MLGTYAERTIRAVSIGYDYEPTDTGLYIRRRGSEQYEFENRSKRMHAIVTESNNDGKPVFLKAKDFFHLDWTKLLEGDGGAFFDLEHRETTEVTVNNYDVDLYGSLVRAVIADVVVTPEILLTARVVYEHVKNNRIYLPRVVREKYDAAVAAGADVQVFAQLHAAELMLLILAATQQVMGIIPGGSCLGGAAGLLLGPLTEVLYAIMTEDYGSLDADVSGAAFDNGVDGLISCGVEAGIDAALAGSTLGIGNLVKMIVKIVLLMAWIVEEIGVGAYDVHQYDAYDTIPGLPPDRVPSFGRQTAGDQAYTVGAAIPELRLPTASGGREPLRYSLTPAVPGLTFDSATRTLSGTPSRAGTYPVTYVVRDVYGDSDSLRFVITVTAVSDPQHAGVRFSDCRDCPQMVVVPAGVFRMGSPSTEIGRDADEGPQRTVTIAQPFAVGIYEVTFEEWEACVAAGGCGGYRPAHEGWGQRSRPVINVSWDDARKYVEWLRGESGKDYRLMSESEWEYAARAGTISPWNTGWTIAPTQGNYGESVGRTTPVGNYAANAFGLHDMHGNVWEWVEDCWASSYAGAPDDGSPRTTGPCDLRVVRGGSWVSEPNSVRSANRNWTRTDFGLNTQGFRVARSLTP